MCITVTGTISENNLKKEIKIKLSNKYTDWKFEGKISDRNPYEN